MSLKYSNNPQFGLRHLCTSLCHPRVSGDLATISRCILKIPIRRTAAFAEMTSINYGDDSKERVPASVLGAHGEFGAGGPIGGDFLTAQTQDTMLVKQQLI